MVIGGVPVTASASVVILSAASGSAYYHLDVTPAPSDSSAVLLNQLLKGDAHLLLNHNRIVHVSGYAE